MWSLHLDNIHGWTMSGMTCYHHPWNVYTIRWYQALQVIIALGHHTQSYNVVRGMPAWPLGSPHGWMMLGVGCHHRLWTTYLVGRDRACYAIIAIGKHQWSDDVRRNMPSLPLDNSHGGMISAWYAIITLGQHIRLENVRRGMQSCTLDRTYGRTTSSLESHYRPWTT